MATVNKITKVLKQAVPAVVIPEVPAVVETKIILELSQDEADTIYTIMGRIGGNPSRSPRQHADSIRHVLFGLASQLPDDLISGTQRAIYFNNYKEETK